MVLTEPLVRLNLTFCVGQRLLVKLTIQRNLCKSFMNLPRGVRLIEGTFLSETAVRSTDNSKTPLPYLCVP